MISLPISEFCKTGSGGTPARSKLAEYYTGGTIPWIKSGELDQPTVESAEEFITEKGLAESSAKLLKPGAILIAMYGATVGQVSRLSITASTNQAICHIYPDEGICDSDYLYRVLKGAKNRLLEKRVGGGQPNISQKIVRELQIPLPPLAEQKRIAGILDAADALRAKRRESLAQLDTLLQSTFLDMFGDPVTNPMGWDLVKLGDYTSKVGSGATPKGGSNSYKTEGIALIRSLNVRDGEFQWKDLARIDDAQAKKLSNVVVEADDVLLNITGASVARVCRVPETVLPARVNQHVCIIRSTDDLVPLFLERLFLAGSMKRKLLGIGESGATRQAITKAQVLELQVPLPPIKLQRRFAAIVESIERQKERARMHLSELDTLFASLQSRAFNGEL